MPNDFDWRAFLEGFSGELLESEEIRSRLPEEVVESGWMGFGGAGEDEIRALEGRLGVRLPPSYRRFLAVSNGWRSLGIFEPGLSPTSGVEWFRERHQDTIAIWQEGERGLLEKGIAPVSDEEYFDYVGSQSTTSLRAGYLNSALLISDGADEAEFLLIPDVVFSDGEWEAWDFAHFHPGAIRTRSFRELMEACLRTLRFVKD